MCVSQKPATVILGFVTLMFFASQQKARSFQQPEGTQTLVAGTPIERELAGGQSHRYELALAAGQYVQIKVMQRGVDIVLRVLSPDGKPILEADGPGGAQSEETAPLVSETAGAYRISIQSLKGDAAAGRYELRVTEPRAATAQDRHLTAGQRLFEEGSHLIAQGARDKFELALKQLEEARVLFQRAGDAGSEGNALNFLGIICLTRGETRRALDYLTPAWELMQNSQEPQAKAALLGNLAVAHAQLGQTAQAAERLKQALPLMRQAKNQGGEAKLLASLGSVHSTLGLLQQALNYYQQAVTLMRTLGDKGSEGVTLNNLGTLYRQLGETDQAREAYQQALPLLRAAGDKRVEAIALDALAVLTRSAGQPQPALELFAQALALRRALGDKRGEAITLDNLGVTHRELGDAQKALELQMQALPLLRAAEDAHRTAITLDNLGLTYRQLGKFAEALDHHRQALPLLQTVGDQLAEAAVLKNIAWIEREQGQLAAARDHIEQTLTRLEFLRANVSGQETRSSFFATVTDYYELNTDILMRLHAVEPQAGHASAALKFSEQGRARSLLELLNETRADIRQGVSPALLERERTLKNQLTAKLDGLIRILNTKAPAAQKSAAQKEVNELTAAYRQTQTEIRQASPPYAALTQPQALDAKDIQRLLDEDTVLFEYALGEKASYLWAVTSSTVTSYALPARTDLEKLARQVYEQLAQRPLRNAAPDEQLAQASLALSRSLLGAASTQLGKKRLVIIAPGVLSYLPFAALPHPKTKKPLLVSHEIANLPSASVLAVLRQESAQHQAAPQTVAIIADPVFEATDPRVIQTKAAVSAAPSFPARAQLAARRNGQRNGFARLAFSRQEAEAIYAVASSGTAWKATDFEASRATITDARLSQYRMLHFATHGLLNNEHPELSGLVFSLVNAQGQPQDGFLRLHEVFNLKLNADLVVLSACATALGPEIKGEGLIGLTRGFMYAGAPRVAASLWNVDDLATAELMKLFYRNMIKDGLRPAAALRAAQLELARQPRWAAPYFWAGFVLQGEWK